MNVSSDSFEDGEVGDDRLALAAPAPDGTAVLSGNRNPHLQWDRVEGAASYVVTCIDVDCPSAPDDVNKQDREVPSSLPRVDFVHWLLADIPADATQIAEAAHADGVVPKGKPADGAPIGVHGTNDYTSWFADDPEMGGVWTGYDGPAPPWNDSIPHRYVFTVYAVDVPTIGVAPGFSRDDLDRALAGHVIDAGSISLTYAVNPRLR